MADRYVTLTATTIGTDISEVSIYHTSIVPANLIASGVTRAQMLTGYTFLDDSTHDTYFVETDSPCDTDEEVNVAVSPTPTPTVTPSISVSPTVTPTQTVTPSITPTQSVTPTQSITPTQSVTPTQTVTPTVTVTVTTTQTPTPSITPTTSVTPTITPTTSVTPTITPTQSVTPTTSVTPTSTLTPTTSITPTPSITPTHSVTPTVTPSITPTQTVTPSITPTQTVTPSITPTQTVTPSITPTQTVTPTVTTSVTPTQSITPTNSVTPTVTITPTASITPSLTPSITVTPSITPSAAGTAPALLFIEPQSQLTAIATYLAGVAGQSWYGFNANSSPTDADDIHTYMEMYANSEVSGLPSVVSIDIPQSGADQYLFEETEIVGGTVSGNAWYTFLIPQDSIGSSTNRVTEILQDTSSSLNNSITPSSTFYDLALVDYTGNVYQNTEYRLYTSFSSQNLRLDNTTNSLFFKGGTVS